jgi:hypothetical protein
MQFKSKLDEDVVVLVVEEAEAVSLEHFTVRHAAIANKDLRAFGVHILASLDLKLVIVRHILQRLLPNASNFVFGQSFVLDYLFGFRLILHAFYLFGLQQLILY